MSCVICSGGQTHAGAATVTLTRGDTTIVIRGVPAEVCTQCGEEYLDAAVAQSLESVAKDAAERGVRFELREYVAA